jgi:Mrp family chromosome partitioning ATPase/capsular polysaccharide biosynthesis protein
VELSFIVTAVRRRLWLIAIFVILGALPGMLQRQQASTLYKAQAVLIVTPPTQSRGATISLSDPDRYVIGQLSVLQSSVLAERVATALGGDETRETIENSIEIIHRPTTDIVDVYARAYTPERARAIADQYTRVYIQDLRTRADDAQSGDIESLQTELAALKEAILAIDLKIEAKMAPYIAAASEEFDAGESGPPIPDVGIVAPVELTERATTLNQYNQVLDNLTELQLVAKLKVTSEIVQEPVLPLEPEPTTGRKAVLAGMFGGGILGVLAAVLFARLSKNVINAEQAGEILGQPLVGSMHSIRSASRSRLAVLAELPSSSITFLDEVSVRAEALASVGKALTVAVVGTERGAAATTLSLALAGRYAHAGSQVILVDADQRDPEISKLFGAAKDSGVPGLLATKDIRQFRGREEPIRGRHDPSPFTSTSVPEIRILGSGSKSDGNSLRRTNVPDVLAATTAEAHVVLIDGGPVLESAVTLQFCQLVDAIILAVPVKRQRVGSLEVVAHQLQSSGVPVLAVATSPTRRRRGQRPAKKEPITTSGEPSVARPVFDDGVSSVAPPSEPRPIDVGEISRSIESSRQSRRSFEERLSTRLRDEESDRSTADD